jgi:glycosyltransferase involved in cell wall biosynthesis
MNGRWTVVPRGYRRNGRPWLVLRGSRVEARQWNGPVLELHARSIPLLGPDILADPPDLERMLANLRREDAGREVGDALLDQRLVAGIGNKWKAEALWQARLSPWRPLGEVGDDELARLYRGARCLVYASLYEGFGLPVAEALACGCPVVTSAGSAMAEIAGGDATYVDPLDVESIRDGIARVAAPARRRRTTWAEVAASTRAVYEELV